MADLLPSYQLPKSSAQQTQHQVGQEQQQQQPAQRSSKIEQQTTSHQRTSPAPSGGSAGKPATEAKQVSPPAGSAASLDRLPTRHAGTSAGDSASSVQRSPAAKAQKRRTGASSKEPSETKRQRVDGGVQSGGSFTNTHVYLDPVSVRGRSGNIWRTWIQQRGGKIAQSVDDRHLTHVIVGESGTTADLPYAKLQAHGVHMVRSAWMEACLAQDKRLPEESFGGGTGTASGGSAGAAVQVSPAKRGHGPLWRYRKWLGKWLPEYDEMTIETEIALQAVFSWDRAQANGNAALVEAFAELYKYEDAVESTLEGADEDINPKDRIDRRALAYARAAAACMGCAFNIGEAVRRGDLDDDDLPFVGDVGARQVKELVLTGTCKELANYRADLAVSTSSGELRPETVGGATRRMFKKLPGVGSHAAYRWYKMGLRSFEDLEAATAGGRNVGLSTDQRFSLQHRANLLEDLPQDELEQMRSVVLDAIAKVRGSREGWRMTVVGGGRRGLPSHDGDFVISHPTESTAGLVRPLCEQLIKDRRMYGAASGMCKIQDTRMATHLDSIREHVEAAGRKGPKDNLLADRFDHIFGNFLTSKGKVRRMDLIIAPAEEEAFCILGWTGSRQWLRYLRLYASQRGMYLNSHRLMRKGEDGRAYIIPDEVPPLDRAKQPFWPPGWGPGCKVTCERDILELLEIPYREPHERNCP